MPPSVRILLPTYEPNPTYLKAAIDGVFHQSWKEWTLLIHDDASQADVRSMVAPYLEDERVTFERSAARMGIGGNWNACLRHSEAPYIQYLFQDDLWYREYLAQSVAALEGNASVGLTCAQHAYKPDNDEACRAFFERAGFRNIEVFKRTHLQGGLHRGREFLRWWMAYGLRPNVVGEPSFVLLRSSLLEKIGSFCEDMPQGLDLDYWLRCLLHADLWYLPEELGLFRVHAHAASMRNDELGAGLFDRLRCFETLLKDPELRPDAKRAVRSQLRRWRRKWQKRVRSGNAVQRGVRAGLLTFALRHPILLLTGLLGWGGGEAKE